MSVAHPPTTAANTRKLPVFRSLVPYERTWLRADLVAGLTVWAVLVPESLAYASIAGVSPVVGLYAAPGALILYAALGSSRHLVVGPMSATAALSAASVATLAPSGSDKFTQLTIALAITTGIAAAIAGLLRLGFLANYISEPVLKGFIVGLALTIIVGQLPKLFGVEKGSGNFFQKLWDLLTELGDMSGEAILCHSIASRLQRFLASPPEVDPAAAFPQLSGRELEILELLAQRRSNAEIAAELYLSQKTVRNYVSGIFSKLQVADRAEAGLVARAAGLGRLDA